MLGIDSGKVMVILADPGLDQNGVPAQFRWPHYIRLNIVTNHDHFVNLMLRVYLFQLFSSKVEGRGMRLAVYINFQLLFVSEPVYGF